MTDFWFHDITNLLNPTKLNPKTSGGIMNIITILGGAAAVLFSKNYPVHQIVLALFAMAFVLISIYLSMTTGETEETKLFENENILISEYDRMRF